MVWSFNPKYMLFWRVWNIALRIFFRIRIYIINDFVHRFILDRTIVNFTVSLLIIPFYNVYNVETTKIVKSTDLWSKINLCTKSLILRK
jgi:hypothetical protein